MFHTTSAKIHYSIIKLNFITRIWSSGLDKKCYLSALGQTSWAPVDFTCWKRVSGVLLSQTEVWIGGLHSCLKSSSQHQRSPWTIPHHEMLSQRPVISLVQQQFFSPVLYWEESCWLGEQRNVGCLQPLQTVGLG